MVTLANVAPAVYDAGEPCATTSPLEAGTALFRRAAQYTTPADCAVSNEVVTVMLVRDLYTAVTVNTGATAEFLEGTGEGLKLG